MLNLKFYSSRKDICGAPITVERIHRPPKKIEVDLDATELGHRSDSIDSVKGFGGALRGLPLPCQAGQSHRTTCAIQDDTPAWTELASQLRELCRRVYAERGSDQACKDCVLQDASTPITEVVEVATRVVLTERVRVVVYCEEFTALADRVVVLVQQTLCKGLSQRVNQAHAVQNALRRVKGVLDAEMSLLWQLDEQAQKTMSQLRNAALQQYSTVEITHAFARPSRHLLLRGAASQSYLKKLYVTYLRVLDDLRRKKIPAAERRIIDAMNRVQNMQSSVIEISSARSNHVEPATSSL